jgi:hypothetical protein
MDTAFDHAAADDALVALRRVQVALRSAIEARLKMAARAREGWQGLSRVKFDADLARLVGWGANLEERLLQAMIRVGDASDVATRQQVQHSEARPPAGRSRPG